MTSLEASDISVPAFQRGFQTLKDETSVAALDAEGRIPDWLTGTLLRRHQSLSRPPRPGHCKPGVQPAQPTDPPVFSRRRRF
jgi:carotenoid cleavage dioxygenase-like enzyme